MVGLILVLFGVFCVFDLVFLLFFFSFLSIFWLLDYFVFSFGGVFFYDFVSFIFTILVILVFFFCLCSGWVSSLILYNSIFMMFLYFMFFLLLLSFSCFSSLFFYMSFELVFMFMFMFILGWGYSPERLQSSFYMVFYTMVVSFPFFVYLVLMGWSFSSFKMFYMLDFYWWVFLSFVFLVKLPVYGVHLWLPKAHVEAPVVGSMILAGVLLKLGGYGLVRFGFFINSFFFVGVGYFISIGLVGGLFSCYLCLRQVDFKAFVAYSSVCHMGFSLVGLFSGFFWGFSGMIFMMVAHGFCSSCLFFILFVFYERFFSRSVIILKGMNFYIPILSGVWFFFSALNMGVPPSLSFFSEFMIFSGSIMMWFFVWFLGGLLLLFSGFYCMILFIYCSYGVSFYEGIFIFLSIREVFNFFLHLFFSFFFVVSMDVFF